MIHLVTGGSGSGKSAYAEQCILDFGGTRRALYRNDAAVQVRKAGAYCTPPEDARGKEVFDD